MPALNAALRVLMQAPNAAALTVTEVNPDHAPDEAHTFARLNEVLVGALTGR